MVVKQLVTLFDGATATGTSAEIQNIGASTLYLQIDGTFTAFTAEVRGKVSADCPGDATVGEINIENNTVYKLDIAGLESVSVKVTAFTGTSYTVVAKFVG